MKRIVLAVALTAIAASAVPASAQYYGPPPPGYGYYDPYGPPRRYRAPRMSDVCATSRGSCPIGGFVPYGSSCRCFIPGFGYKRGGAM
ncbi:hypothetical protein [Enterovirga rhinocerotis]|uniref:Uncharacterized protein n=1 Tax=Enterovirga rhinocerotis TaxID=1339210 RepID=A0A4R7BXC0_9HYPH|nr:hypothetical protein [Enterovirga rhinocerotis]TDR89862.1 hypothetical protein EV668_2698 [Enterovirga rhinocerotis]